MNSQADIVVIGAGLAGLVAATSAIAVGRQVILIDQENEASLGGQAFWSFGGLFMVDTPEQRLMRIKDNHDLAFNDWLGSAQFAGPHDYWPKKWAEAYVAFASGEKRAWLTSLGVGFMKIVMWAERGGYLATQHGNSVPRFHITWGTGPGLLEPFIHLIYKAQAEGRLKILSRHKVTELLIQNNTVVGCSGNILEPANQERGYPSSRNRLGDFKIHAQAVIITSGGIGGNHTLVRKYWQNAPKEMLSGVPDYVDGSMLEIAERAGAHLINMNRMWHYPEGVKNYDSIWSNHGIRILSGPTPLWLDARGNRLPGPLFPGFDSLGALKHICESGFSYSWFLLNKKIIKREFALSGSEQNPDLTGKHLWEFLSRAYKGTMKVNEFLKRGEDFIIADQLEDLVKGMNRLTGNDLIQLAELRHLIQARDEQIASGLGKDSQIMAIAYARRYLGDRLFRVTKLGQILASEDGPLIAVRLWVLTRKTMGGLETNLEGQVLNKAGQPIAGLYAAGEVTGFGGGGMLGHRALEGTFLGGCLFSGRIAGTFAAKNSL